MTETRTNNMPSRRAVTKAAAWSAPVIAAAVAAPMAAASTATGQLGQLTFNPTSQGSSSANKWNAPPATNTLQFAAKKDWPTNEVVLTASAGASINGPSFSGTAVVYSAPGVPAGLTVTYTVSYSASPAPQGSATITWSVSGSTFLPAGDFWALPFPSTFFTLTAGSNITATSTVVNQTNTGNMSF